MINKLPLAGVGITRRLETLTVGYSCMPSNRNHSIVDSEVIMESLLHRFIDLGAKHKSQDDPNAILIYHKVNDTLVVENASVDTITVVQIASKNSAPEPKARGIMLGINRHLKDTNYYTNVLLFDRISDEVSGILYNQIEHKIRDSKSNGTPLNLNFYF